LTPFLVVKQEVAYICLTLRVAVYCQIIALDIKLTFINLSAVLLEWFLLFTMIIYIVASCMLDLAIV
jgi:hypothetical protein